MKTSIKLTIIFLFTITIAAFAQKSEYKNDPGFIDFGDLSQFQSGENVTEVTLDENLLKMAAGFTKNDHKASKLMSGLKFIKVNSFEVDEKNESQLMNKIKSIDNDLTSKNWSRIVKSKSNDESANVYIKTGSNGEVVGLVVTSIGKGGEAAFINIVGNIDMDAVSDLGSELNIHSLGNFGKKHKGK